jgi:hypothetical protein
MFGKNGFDLRFIQSSYFDNYEQTFFLVLSGVIIWLAPNTRQIMGENFPALYIDKYNECEKSIIKLKFKLNYFWVCFICSLAMMSFLSMAGISEFLYFQF